MTSVVWHLHRLLNEWGEFHPRMSMVICDMIYFHIRYAHLRRISFLLLRLSHCRWVSTELLSSNEIPTIITFVQKDQIVSIFYLLSMFFMWPIRLPILYFFHDWVPNSIIARLKHRYLGWDEIRTHNISWAHFPLDQLTP